MKEQARGGIENFDKRLSQLLLFAVPTLILIIALIFREVDLKDLPKLINLKGILYITLTLLFIWVFNAIKMLSVVRIMQGSISFYKSFQVVLAAVFGANITPFYSGGALTQTYFLTKHSKNIGKSSAVSVMYLILSLMISIVFCIIFIVSPHQFITGVRGNFFLGLVIFVLLLSVIIILLIKFPKNAKALIEKIYKKIAKKNINDEKLNETLFQFSEGFELLFRNNSKLMLLALISAFASQFLNICLTPLSFYALHIPFRFSEIFLTQIAMQFTVSLGASPGGIGVIEGAFAGFFYLLAPEKIALLTFVYRLTSFYIPTFVGSFFFWLLLKEERKNDN